MARTHGSLNKTRFCPAEYLKSRDCNPFEGMLRIAQKAEEKGDLVCAGTMYRELARYLAPQLKAIDFKGTFDSRIVVQVSKLDELI